MWSSGFSGRLLGCHTTKTLEVRLGTAFLQHRQEPFLADDFFLDTLVVSDFERRPFGALDSSPTVSGTILFRAEIPGVRRSRSDRAHHDNCDESSFGHIPHLFRAPIKEKA